MHATQFLNGQLASKGLSLRHFPSLATGPLHPQPETIEAFKHWYTETFNEKNADKASSLTEAFPALQVLTFDTPWQERGFIKTLDAAKIPMGFHPQASLQAFPETVKLLLKTMGVSLKKPLFFIPQHTDAANAAAFLLASFHVWRYFTGLNNDDAAAVLGYQSAANLFMHRHLKRGKPLSPKDIQHLDDLEKASLLAYLQEDMDAYLALCI